MFFIPKECDTPFSSNLESMIGAIIFNLKYKKENHCQCAGFPWKSKIVSSLNVSDIERIYSDMGVRKKGKKLYSRNWKEFKILMEITFLAREYNSTSRNISFNLLTFPFFKSKFNYSTQTTPGSSKNLVIILSLMVFLWGRNLKVKWKLRKKDQVLIVLESRESKKQILNSINKSAILIGIFNNSYDQKNFHLKRNNLNRVLLQKTSFFFNIKNRDFFIKKKFNLIIMELLVFDENFPFFFDNLGKFLKNDIGSNQKFILTSAKKFSFFLTDLHFVPNWNFGFFFYNQFFFFEKYEMCGNSYIKLSKFLEILSFFKKPLFVFVQNYNLSIFLSKLIPFFYQNNLKKLFGTEKTKKMPLILDKKKIYFGHLIQDNFFFDKSPRQIIFFDPPLIGEIFSLNIKKKKKKKLLSGKVFFFKNSEKKLFTVKIQELFKRILDQDKR